MYKTNVIVLVYEQQRNKVVIWDDHEKKNRTEITFNANQLIMNVKLRKDMMIVVLNEKAFIFNFVTLKLIEQVDTYLNPRGLCALSQAEKPISKIICLPHNDKGSLKVLNYGKYSSQGYCTGWSLSRWRIILRIRASNSVKGPPGRTDKAIWSTFEHAYLSQQIFNSS